AVEYLAWSSTREIRGYIEEPDAHLHPEGQRDIVNLMAAVYNQREAPLQLLLTTHTPYLLSSFNNLIYAGQLDKQLEDNDIIGRKKLYATVPKELHMQLADFRVYGIENGKATSLIDEEFGLLMAQSLDSVSDIIADQFGALMDLDPANKSSPAEQ
ncbi:MAG TPA: AAA family ATPase, partial [Hymenobacter sp.]